MVCLLCYFAWYVILLSVSRVLCAFCNILINCYLFITYVVRWSIVFFFFLFLCNICVSNSQPRYYSLLSSLSFCLQQVIFVLYSFTCQSSLFCLVRTRRYSINTFIGIMRFVVSFAAFSANSLLILSYRVNVVHNFFIA